jgi:DNA-binding NarL/FixJ family response regulator
MSEGTTEGGRAAAPHVLDKENTATPGRLRVAIVDDSAELRKRLAALIPQDGSAAVVAYAASVFEAIGMVWDQSPDVVVLDFQLQDGTALNVLDGIEGKAPRPFVIVLTNYPEPIYRSKCMEAGAYRFLDKSTEFDQLTDAIREISGGTYGN